MPATPRFTSVVTAVLLGSVLCASASAAPSASLDQVRNGTADATSTPTPTWSTGNAGASNSHYLESHSIAYRAIMNDLPTDGTVIELIVGYDVKRSGSYALDYLTHYQRLLPHVLFAHRDPEVFDPLSGIAGVGPTVTTAPIPIATASLVIDPDGAESEPAMPQPTTSMGALPADERLMTLFGGTLIDVTYVSEANVALNVNSSETQVRVRFTADSPAAVLAWGGHIASRWDWGFNADGSPRSAGGINGSSYHMRLVSWNLGGMGNQDRSMSTDAVYPVPRCMVSNLGPFCAGSTNTHTAPSGMESYSWELFDNTAGAVIVGSSTGTSVLVQTSTGGSYSLMLTTTASGFLKQCSATATVNPPVIADAGTDLVSCASAPQVQLVGAVTGGSASWTGGTGTFSPGRNVPNPTYTPSASEITAGGVTLTLTCVPSGPPCPPVSDAVRITIDRVAVAAAGPDQSLCSANPQVQLAGTVNGSATGGTWSGGSGSFQPSPAALNAIYTPTADEIAAGGVTLTLTTDDPAGPCNAVSDAVRINISPAATADAGADQTVCSSSPQVQLAGSIGGGASSGTWSGGAGSFQPSASAVNAIYTPTAAEITAGGVTLTLTTNDPSGPCSAVSDAVRITLNRAATANAGSDQTVCATSPQVQLAGSFGGGAASGAWSGGDGSFLPSPSAPNAIYTPSAGEIAAGGVTLTFATDDPDGPCLAASDQVQIHISPAATVDAGADQTVCSSGPQVQLAGAVSGSASSGTWSGGNGSFQPSPSAPNAIYTPSAGEIAAGGVTLTFTTNDPSGPCPPVSDVVRLTFDRAATANAGADQTVCATSPQMQLAGSFGGGAASGAWSGGNGSFQPSPSAPNAIYTPSAGEIAAGNVTLTFTTNDPPGPCLAVSDQVQITISPAATVNAGADQIVCAGNPQVPLAGTVGGSATNGTWSGGNGSFQPNASALNATYTPSAAEIAAGSVTLTLTTGDPAGPCPAVQDQVTIIIDPITVVNAGSDQTLCSTDPQAQLAGSVSGTVSSGSWTGGNGTFSPSRSSLNPIYTPTAAEIAAGSVTLTLTSAASSRPCPPGNDSVTLYFAPAATVNAGADVIVCAASPSVTLSASVGGGASGGTWSGGAGSFSPNASAPNATYTPTAAEVAARSVTLTFTTNDPSGPCPPVSDAVKITFDAPTVSVTNKVVCDGVFPVTLCANPGNGITPYTYAWSNGATTQCITVADTSRYTVTITDARGCVATGSGSFQYRECVGQIAHTNTTCATYQAGTNEDMPSGDVNVQIRENVITNLSPGVFFYWTKISAPSANFTVDIVQTRSNPDAPFCEVQQGQVVLYDENCNSLGNGYLTGPGQAAVDITGATPGDVFIISVKYSLKSLVDSYLDPSVGVRYDFTTVIDGTIVDGDPDGLVISLPGTTGVGDEEPSITPLELYRPAPNPFHNRMRIAYSVSLSGETVDIGVYDIAGRRVRTLARGLQSPGRHVTSWDGRDERGAEVRSGMYFVRVRIGTELRHLTVTFLN